MSAGWLKAGTGPRCPYCGAAIGVDDVNVSTDLALCRACGRTASYAGLVEAGRSTEVDQPNGCEYEELSDGFRLRATTRSAMALFLIPFTCFWSGFSLKGIYGEQIRAGRFDPFESLFGLIFVAGTVMLVGMCAMSVAGHVEVTVREERLTIFSGVGPVGRRRRLVWSDYDAARERMTKGSKGRVSHEIALEGRKQVAFGSALSEERRYWMLQMVRRRIGVRR